VPTIQPKRSHILKAAKWQIGHESYSLDLSYSAFIAGYFSTLNGLLQSVDQVQAQQLCLYLKFSLKKGHHSLYPSYFANSHDKFHGMDMRGEATCDDQSFLNDLQAHPFNCSVVKAPKIVSTDSLIGVNSAPSQPGNSCGKHCYKWNKDSNNCTGCIL